MPVAVIRHEELPLIIATLTGDVVTDDIIDVFKQSAALLKPQDEVVYRITHILDAQSTFPEMLKAIQEATLNQDASTADKRIRPIFVGTSSWITFARNAFNKRGIQIPAFDSMKTAIEYVQIELQKQDIDASELDDAALEDTSSQAVDL